METRKMPIKITYGLLCLSVLVLIGLNIFQRQQLKKLSECVNKKTVANNESTRDTISRSDQSVQNNAEHTVYFECRGKESNTNDIDDPNDQLDETQKEQIGL